MPQRLKEAHIDPINSEVLEKTSALQEMRISTVAQERGLLNQLRTATQVGCIELDN